MAFLADLATLFVGDLLASGDFNCMEMRGLFEGDSGGCGGGGGGDLRLCVWDPFISPRVKPSVQEEFESVEPDF